MSRSQGESGELDYKKQVQMKDINTPSLPQATSIDPINKSIPPNPNQSPSNKALLPPRPKLSYTPEVDDRIRLSSRRPYDPRDDHRRDYDHEYDRERYLDDRERYHDDRSRARDRDRDRDCRERERDRGRHRSRSRSRSRSRGRDREWERETERRSIRPPYPLHERISERDRERERSRRYSRSPPPGCGSSRISLSSSHRRRLSPSVACPPGYPYDRRDDRDLRTSLDCDYRPPLDRRDFDRYEPRRNLVRGDDYERRRDEEYERRREEEYERRKREDWHAHRSRRSPSPPRLRHSPSPAKRPSVTLSSLVPPVPRSPPPPPRARLASPSRSHSPSGYYLPVYPPGRSPSRLRPYSRSRSPSSSRSPPKLHYHPRSPPPGPSQAIQSRSPSNALSKACPPTLSASHQTSLPSSSRMKVFQQSLSLPTQTHPARVVSESYLSRSPSPSSVLSPRETRSASPPSVQAKVQSFTDNLPPKSYVVTRKALASSLDMTRESDAQTSKQTVLKQARAVSKIPSQDISPGPDTSTKETSHIPHPDSLVQNDSISGSPVVGQSAHQANHDGSIFSVHRISPDERSSHLTSSADNHSRPTTTDYHLTTGPRSYRAHDHESSETDRKRQKMMGSPYDRSSLPSAPQSPRPSLTEDVAPSSSRQLLKPPPARNTVIVDPSSERTLISSSARKDVEHSSTRASYPTSSSVHTRSLPTHSSTAVKIPPSIPTGPRAGVPIGPRAWASQKLTKAPVTSIRTSPVSPYRASLPSSSLTDHGDTLSSSRQPPQNISPKSYRDSAGMTSGSTRLPRSDHYPHSAPFPSADALSGPPLNTPASEVFMSPLPVSIPITIPPPAPPPPPPNHPRASNNSLSEAKSSFNVRSNTPIPTPSGSNSPVTTFGKQPTLNVVSSTPAANQIAKSSITANGLGLRKDSIGGIASSSSSGSAPSIPITTATPAASSSTQVRVNNYPGGKLHPSTQAYGSVGGNYVGSNGMSGNNQPHVGATVQVSPPVIDRDLERAQRMCEVCPSLEQEIAKLRSTRNSSMLASHLNCKVASEKTLAELKYQMIEMKVLSERRKLAEAQLDRHGGGISLAMGF
ncbi:uncharacterized protein MELLADRAFT_62246 [Melampsora larici-populina 98AG31]|uniref:Uncharacterized protein n=1 Tax=Melampsora larici-populina (strain 98AG31 / pathotype 3-4-7) TaxID=747676 RepID=F4RI51_MELLP|nr:uncharacterized protein MELLADRAFT_62246 [Melampsora larici-populina 98AG31]EGG07939.1 hypothetical protein MELLADRAFT_62246 [Melampsora larici-populina 98AG31]